MKIDYVGNGKVYLIAGGNKIYTDIAARFVRSERPVKEIIESPYNPQIVKNILESGHGAALEFDYFIFGVEGYSRVCETQLVRKRMASYLIKSGRQELNSKREFSMVLPEQILKATARVDVPTADSYFTKELFIDGYSICSMIEQWYDQNLKKGEYKEEDLRYLKPQATEFKAIIGMNCYDEQTEVLTTNGWKYVGLVNKNDLVYSLNINTKEVEYIKPNFVFYTKYTGLMVNVKTRRIDLCTTPNHNNLIYTNCHKYISSGNARLHFVEAGCMDQYENISMYRNCKRCPGEYKEYITFKEINNYQHHHNGNIYPEINIPMNEFLQFLGFYISDGSIFRKKTKNEEVIQYDICLSKGDKNKLLKYKRLIDSWFNIDSKIYDNNHGCYKLQFKQPQLGLYLHKLGNCYTKYIPKEFFKLPKEQLIHLLNGLIDGDCNKRKDICSYTTVSKQLADDLQILLLHCGLSGSIRKYDFRNKIHPGGISLLTEKEYPPIIAKSISYVINFTLHYKDYESVKTYDYNNISYTDYSGYVYCLELPINHTLYVRRNGKPIWSGNSHSLRDWFKIRTCQNAQSEIRDLANKMLKLCKEVSPDLFKDAGPSCKVLGYCPENRLQNEKCKGKIYTKEEALEILKNHKKNF